MFTKSYFKLPYDLNLEKVLGEYLNEMFLEQVFLISLITAIVVCTLFAIIILKYIGKYKTFEKMGINGWKALIPFYGTYSCMKKVKMEQDFLFYIVFVLMFLFSIIVEFEYFWMICLIGALIVLAEMYIRISKGFGKSHIFGICMLLVEEILYPVLGFGKNKYQQPEEIICPECSSELTNKDNFCPNCGKKIKGE